MSSFKKVIFDIRRGWLSVPLFYILLLVISGAVLKLAYSLPYDMSSLPKIKLGSLSNVISSLYLFWPIFVWGFSLQLIMQIIRIFRRTPRDGSFSQVLKRGIWISLNAGVFEEIIFRCVLFITSIISVLYLDSQTGGSLKTIVVNIAFPVANLLTFGFFSNQFSSSNWAVGISVIVGGVFFSSAHAHYGFYGRVNVWVIGMIMFWVFINYGLIAAIFCHVVYDICVFLAVAAMSPLQRAKQIQR